MTAELPYPLVHTDQTQPIVADRSSVESAAVIRDRSKDPFTRGLQGHFNFVRTRMLGDVGEGFLNHPVETGPVGVGKAIERGIDVSLNLHATRSRHFPD